MKINRIKYLLQQHVHQKLTKSESEELEEGLASGAHDTEFESIFQEVWEENQANNLSDVESDNLRIQQVLERIEPKRRVRHLQPMLYIASSLLLIFSFIKWGIPHLNNAKTTEEQSLITQTISIPYGEKKKIALPDSTIVFLNSGTTISYSSDFNQKLREVNLKGEAFFEVKKDTSKPFRIHIKDSYIEVLGTSFNVKSYPNDLNLAVTVNTGKVEVGKMDMNLQKEEILGVLTQKKRMIYEFSNHNIQIDSLENAIVLMNWKEQIISFENQKLAEIALVLERWYNVEFSFKTDESKDKRYSGEFNNLPLKKLLEILALSNSFKYRIEQKKIIID
ncbi:FecR family protein [Sphingobacterium sp. HJSM2_6]|uniref:FecR family protein n=1 Tax=Sphingobacterium sp. HJSM2_6 TaxID=3366264 RepID=UPI003BE89B41